MTIVARFLGDPRTFTLVFAPFVQDDQKLNLAHGWAQRGNWVRSVVSLGNHYGEVRVDLAKAYVLEPDEHGPDPLSLLA